jgi:E3 ubiquitin-protein ligase SHPRH
MLQNQWIDELKTHAPSLKVLVYEGWAKVIPKLKAVQKKVPQKVKTRAVSRHSAKRSASVSVEEPDLPEQNFDWPTEANQYDVVITTYQVLKSDLNVARAARLRPHRSNVIYCSDGPDAPRSPLVRVEWYRVVMDEVQMVGGGKTE